MALRRSNRIPPPPPGRNRFDSWDPGDVFSALETSLMEATAQMDAYRQSRPEEKPKPLALMASRLEMATEALEALRRAVANDERFR